MFPLIDFLGWVAMHILFRVKACEQVIMLCNAATRFSTGQCREGAKQYPSLSNMKHDIYDTVLAPSRNKQDAFGVTPYQQDAFGVPKFP